MVTDEVVKQIADIRDRGLSIRDIAKQTGVPRPSVHRALQRHGTAQPSSDHEFESQMGIPQVDVALPRPLTCPECGVTSCCVSLCDTCGRLILHGYAE